MADNVAITAGSGTTIATDDIGGTHYPRKKVVHGADGSATDTSEDAPFPVRAIVDVFTVTPTVDTSANVDGDILFGHTSISNVFLNSGGGRTLMSVTVQDKADLGLGIDLVFLDAATSLGTAGGAPSLSDTDGESIIGRVSISSAEYYDMGAFKLAVRTGINLAMQGNASTSLWVAGIVRGSGTFGASDIKLKLGFQ